MLKFARRQTLHIWIAMLAVLFSALAPAISHALAAAAPERLVEICTVDGVKTLSLAAADISKAPAKSMHGMEHCPYCVTHGGSTGLPPAPAMTLAVIGGHDLYPSLFYSAPRPLYQWSAGQPRAPPAIA